MTFGGCGIFFVVVVWEIGLDLIACHNRLYESAVAAV